MQPSTNDYNLLTSLGETHPGSVVVSELHRITVDASQCGNLGFRDLDRRRDPDEGRGFRGK